MAIIDSQSVRTTEVGGEHGFDGSKKVNGRKRHILVDTMGNLLKVVAHAANIGEREGAKQVLMRLPALLWTRLVHQSENKGRVKLEGDGLCTST